MKAINPATNELIKDYDEHDDDAVKDILKKVDNEFKSWSRTDFAHRSKLMKKAAGILKKNKDDYARTMAMEMGKPITEARSEAEKCAWVCEYYAENAEKFLADMEIETDASRSFVAFQPLGTVLAIMPWNFPFWQVFRFAAPALMAGNTGILKHASNVPGSALKIEEVFREAGFPENAFRSLLISSSKVEGIIKDDRIKAVTLTGSEFAGMQVAAQAGSVVKKTVMELGGSDPYIVLEDADMPSCVETSAKARMINNGQSCIAAKRFIVVKSKLKEFEEAQTNIMKNLKVGDPLDEETQAGPMARQDLMEDLHEQVKQSVEKGAKLLTGGEPMDREGAFYPPTVLTNCKKGMKVVDEETFGPVSAIIPVKDAEEAIAVANDSQYGLGGAVWSQDVEKAIEVARRVETGNMFVNGMTKSDPRLPFGGVKNSGYGRELSVFGIREFVNIKTIWVG
ncbi:MAG: NAD-dependent succinate-semialdehyde dehydrogenase [candidate division Zixibacteria bacterium]|nr:NAD-dependent succinate-semialdehyde dehydrogenase [candidate division Zixibacteria bacterium]NIR65115.1 NAD-dependent succinate-semialdehyde dehydrogenase [candidate division Zixibacteria bacterium]NIS17849.1 NAD-dependent succinate-semialdehyde dehydrogenase [candidate division Zixibacteria bacterium]NIS46859.1 NAD-dependent succinate-semialdehyde dehydrogenase [candidate division Zixibacteria bacterium]NIT54571.1 NAD-dependent succinate-semialdehyde dehydrogenase [candidate division Zixib